MNLIAKTVRAPEIGQAWINSPPLSLRSQKGQVVLVDFWDYTCVNCLRTLPYVTTWHEKYRDYGLTVIGIHAPEFSFARTYELIERATQELGIHYPVMLDNDYQAWQAFANKCWPAKYLIDKDGYIRYFQLGEGGYQEFEEALQELLSDRDPSLKLPPLMPLVRELDRPGVIQACQMATPELHLGHARGAIVNGFQQDNLAQYKYGDAPLEPDAVELSGWWISHRECLEAEDTNGARLRLRFGAAQVNVVAEGRGVIEVRLDGKPLTEIPVQGPRMYQLLDSAAFTRGVLELAIHDPAVKLYAFTFVTCVEGR
jgi:thiol-disulfide isomerase/thioredoxin